MIGFKTDIGNSRKINEDFYGYVEHESIRIYAVADGMGGHNAGEIASKMAIENTLEDIKNGIDIREAIIKANISIYNKGREQENLTGMGTTLTLAKLDGRELTVAHVGDSSCFIVRENDSFKATKDHSLVQELIEIGSITEEEARTHPNKNVITRALGASHDIEVDIYNYELREYDKVVLASDGMTNYVEQEEIYEIVKNNNVQDACQILIDLSKDRGGRDNITVLIFEGVR